MIRYLVTVHDVTCGALVDCEYVQGLTASYARRLRQEAGSVLSDQYPIDRYSVTARRLEPDEPHPVFTLTQRRLPPLTDAGERYAHAARTDSFAAYIAIAGMQTGMPHYFVRAARLECNALGALLAGEQVPA